MTTASLDSPTHAGTERPQPASLANEHPVASGEDRCSVPISRAEWAALGAILLVSLGLQVGRLDLQGIGNPYYAATVRSMLGSWHAFFFASFDPAGFVAVDKPPLGFWAQTASAKLFGFSGVALILPPALATVASVGLLWALVRRPFGGAAALVAAPALALTPIAVAAGRTNTIDPLLVLLLLGAAWTLARALEHGRFPWLLASAALIGLGFNVKMLQAYLVVPAWGVTYLLAGRPPLPRRVAHLAAAGIVLLLVSFSWATVVQLTPPDLRPYVGSSSTNSPFDLAFGYNGLQRLLPPSLTGGEQAGAATPNPGAILGAFGAVETGERGPLRLFNGALAAQIAWLLPLATVGLATAWRQEPGVWERPVSARRAALVFWGSWLLTAAVFFSVANQFHRYYLVMLAPPTAALAGAGLAALWADWRRPGWRGWLLPIAVGGEGILAAAIVAPFPHPGRALVPLLVALGVIAAAGLAAVRLARGATLTPPWPGRLRAVRVVAAGAAAGALAVGPAIWSAWALAAPVSNVLPAAGPGGPLFPAAPLAAPGPAAGGPMAPFDTYTPPDPALVAYLAANHGDEQFVLATANSMSAAPLVIGQGWPVAALGGFIGQDPILTTDQLKAMVDRGELRFFLVPDPGRVGLLTTMVGAFGAATTGGAPALPFLEPPAAGAPAGDALPNPAKLLRLFLSDNVRWIADHCAPVPAAEWQTPGRTPGNPLVGLERLYDCGAVADAAR